MAAKTCPHCGSILTAGEAAGSSCPACRKSFTGAGSPSASTSMPSRSPTPAPLPLKMPRTSSSQPGPPGFLARLMAGRIGSILVRLAIFAILLGGIALFGLAGDLYRAWFWNGVEVTIDNATSDAIEVQLDGKPVLTVGPRQSDKVACRPGAHQITVLRHGEKTYDAQHMLKRPEGRKPVRYVLNPDGTQRYWIRTINYGSTFPTFGTTKYDTEGKLLDLAYEISLVEESGPWYEVKTDIVLDEPIPDKVEGYITASLGVFSRIDALDYDRLLKARSPSELFPLPKILGDDPSVEFEAEQERDRKLDAELSYLEGLVSRLQEGK